MRVHLQGVCVFSLFLIACLGRGTDSGLVLCRPDVAEPTEAVCYRSDRVGRDSLVGDLLSDAWHKRWYGFHNMQVASAAAFAVDPLSVLPT